MSHQFTDLEKQRLFELLNQHTAQNETIEQQNAKIERGLYGDAPNGVKGALGQIADLKADVKVIQGWIDQHNLKTAYISGVVAACVVALRASWEWMTRK